MYFNKNNQFYHGIMFHHFHDDKIYKRSQGSINKTQLFELINFIGRKNILDADVFLEKSKANELKQNEVCITFDDAVKSQIDIALPVLEDLKIKSFFFVYTSLFEGKPDNLEIFRFFRHNYFSSIDKFYSSFYKFLDKDIKKFFLEKEKTIKEKKLRYPFYSVEDIKFRLIRSKLLNKKEYENIMLLMMKDRKFDKEKYLSILFFNEKDLNTLADLDHLVGLHSHTHPISIENLSAEEQKFEYTKCLNILKKILGKKVKKINSMSHPCGSYNDQTLKVLKDLNIEIGFRNEMTNERRIDNKKVNNSFLEIARQDHSEIIKRMK